MLVLLFIVALLAMTLMWWAEIVALVLGVWLFLNLNVIAWIVENPWKAALYVAGYFLVGAVWSVIKWWFHETDQVSLLGRNRFGMRP